MALEQITLLDEPHDYRATCFACTPPLPAVCPLFSFCKVPCERGDQTSQIGWEGEEIIIFGGTSDWDAWVTLVSVVS